MSSIKHRTTTHATQSDWEAEHEMTGGVTANYTDTYGNVFSLVNGVVDSVFTPVEATIDFPRLAMWWPLHDSQSNASIAAYDIVGMQNYDSDHIAAYRALNSDIKLLGSNDAHNIAVVWTDYNHSTNVELRTLSFDWTLCQGSSTTAEALDTSETGIDVVDGSKFRAGDIIIVGVAGDKPTARTKEVLKVDTVVNNTITVTGRGLATPALSHNTGVYIAAAVVRNTGASNFVFDLTSDCPSVDVGYGAEQFCDWNARRANAHYIEADWDGTIIDNAGEFGTYWVNGTTVRTIAIAHGATTYTTGELTTLWKPLWDNGIVAYFSKIRSAMGPAAMILGNFALRNYAGLNGTLIEDAPRGTWDAATWATCILGPYSSPRCSYMEYLTNGLTPKTSILEAYNPSSLWSDMYTANGMRKMRFGLCSTLMGDGYYSYEVSTNGHGKLGLAWYDEYGGSGGDAARTGTTSPADHQNVTSPLARGYLGQPVAPYEVAGATGCYKREFDNGLAIVNADSTAHTITVSTSPSLYRRIDGNQDTVTNDGTSNVTSVTVEAHDGIVLLKSVPVISDSYDSGITSAASLHLGANVAVGQTFNASVGGYVNKAQFYLSKTGAPTGNVTAAIYALTGTPGTTGKATGTALATSAAVDIASVPSLRTLITFEFPTSVELTQGTGYVVAVQYSGGDGSNYLAYYYDVDAGDVGANATYSDGAWDYNAARDVGFYVYVIA